MISKYKISFYLFGLAYVMISCQYENEISMSKLEKFDDVTQPVKYKYINELVEDCKHYNFPIDLNIYASKSYENSDQYWIKSDKTFIPVHFSPSDSIYDDSTVKYIVYELSNFGDIETSRSFCYYNSSVRDSFCIHKVDGRVEYQEYKNDLKDDLCIINTNNFKQRGKFRSIRNGVNRIDMDIDTFNSFDQVSFEEKIFIKRLGGKSEKIGNWEVIDKVTGQIDTIKY